MRVNLIASNGKYVCAEGGGGYVGAGSLIANRTVPNIWEAFNEETFEDGISLKTWNGNYITAELDNTISTDRTTRGAWEKWYKVANGYKSVHGKFMVLDTVNLDIEASSLVQTNEAEFQRIELDPVSALPALHVSGHYFYDESGNRKYIKLTTDMMLYKHYLENNSILDSLLKQRSENECNAVRILGMVSWFDYYPAKYGQRYFDEIPRFLDLVGSHGMYVYWTVFADTQIVMPELNNQLAHFNTVVAQLKTRKNVFGELVNEPYTGTNATANPLAFTRPTGIPFSSGSYNDKYGSQLTPPPYWDFHDFHVPRKDVKRVADQCMVTHPNYVKKGMAILSGEPDKFGGPNVHNPQIYLTDADLSRQMEVTARGTAAGYCYHTSAGNFSVLWNDTEIRCCPFTMED